MTTQRYARHGSFFGEEGQRRIRNTKFTIVGLGGTGSHVAVQAAYLGGVNFRLVDKDFIDETSLNRTVTAQPGDEELPNLKVHVAKRTILAIQPGAAVTTIDRSVISPEGFAAVKDADVVFGCVDRDSVRLILNEVCQAYEILYVDLATDISSDNPMDFGGRIHLSIAGERCVFCDDLLDQTAIRHDFESAEQREADERIYGVNRSELGRAGPSVVSLNGLVASSAVLECMIELTGLRPAVRWLEYRGAFGVLSARRDPPKPHCPFCKGSLVRGRGDRADLQKYLELNLNFRL